MVSAKPFLPVGCQRSSDRRHFCDFICSVGHDAPNRHWHISSSSQSPRCKAHLRHGQIRVMKYAAHWQRHQSDDSGRTDNKGNKRGGSSTGKRERNKKKSWIPQNQGDGIVIWTWDEELMCSYDILHSHTLRECKRERERWIGTGLERANHLRPDIPFMDTVCSGSPLWQLIKVSC